MYPREIRHRGESGGRRNSTLNLDREKTPFEQWKKDIISRDSPTFFPIGEGELARIEIGPGSVTLLGGAPGAGKTAFVMQAAIDALRLSPALRALVVNVEMSPGVLFDRQLARFSGVDLTTIRYRRFDRVHGTGKPPG